MNGQASMSIQRNDYYLWYMLCFQVSPYHVQLIIYDRVDVVKKSKKLSNGNLNKPHKMPIIILHILIYIFI